MIKKKYAIITDCTIGENTTIYSFVNLYGCAIGNNCRIGTFVEIQKGVQIGNLVKIQSHSFLCEGVTIENEVFIGHHVVFINDRYPKATNKKQQLQTDTDWELQRTIVKIGASIGSNATILGGITIGEYSIVGAGSVVTKSVAPYTIVAGNPARVIRKIRFG